MIIGQLQETGQRLRRRPDHADAPGQAGVHAGIEGCGLRGHARRHQARCGVEEDGAGERQGVPVGAARQPVPAVTGQLRADAAGRRQPHPGVEPRRSQTGLAGPGSPSGGPFPLIPVQELSAEDPPSTDRPCVNAAGQRRSLPDTGGGDGRGAKPLPRPRRPGRPRVGNWTQPRARSRNARCGDRFRRTILEREPRRVPFCGALKLGRMGVPASTKAGWRASGVTGAP